MSDTVLIHYCASSNSHFNGVIDTGITKSDWAEMSEEQRDRAVDDEIYNLIDISVEDE